MKNKKIIVMGDVNGYWVIFNIIIDMYPKTDTNVYPIPFKYLPIVILMMPRNIVNAHNIFRYDGI